MKIFWVRYLIEMHLEIFYRILNIINKVAAHLPSRVFHNCESSIETHDSPWKQDLVLVRLWKHVDSSKFFSDEGFAWTAKRHGTKTCNISESDLCYFLPFSVTNSLWALLRDKKWFARKIPYSSHMSYRKKCLLENVKLLKI